MANETTLVTSLSNTRSGVTVTEAASLSITQAGSANLSNVQTLSTTTAAINFGGVTSPGYISFKNIDPTNTISIGLVTPVTTGPGNAMFTLLPGEPCAFPTRQTVIYAIASAGTPQLAVTIASL